MPLAPFLKVWYSLMGVRDFRVYREEHFIVTYTS